MSKTKETSGMKRVKTMGHINFLYWLQGFFEIGKPVKISQGQLKEIKSHLKIVDKKNDFISWLEGFLDAWELANNSEAASKEFCKTIKEKLASSFEKITLEKKLEDISSIFDKPFPDTQRGPCYPHTPMIPREPWQPKIYC